jgi:uncharacterized protein YciI
MEAAMKTLLALLLLAAPVTFAQEPARLFVVHFSTGPAWLADKPFNEQPHSREHSQNLARLRSEGMLLLGARYADKGMIVLRAANEAAARAEIERDPAILAGIFVFEIALFQPFYEGCVSQKPETCRDQQ